MSAASVQVRREGALARLSLAHGELNILDMPTGLALAEAVRAASDDRDVAAIVLDGGSARGFSAGVEIADHTPERIDDMLAAFHAGVRALWNASVPSVALVHGFAMGGGLELALACDWAVCESDARLGLPEIRLGCYPPVAAAVLPARIGWARAAELTLGGAAFTPQQALEWGVVHRVCAPGARESALHELLAPVLAQSPAVVREARAALRIGATHAPGDALDRIERRYVQQLMTLDDAREGIAAHTEKRAPQWRNR